MRYSTQKTILYKKVLTTNTRREKLLEGGSVTLKFEHDRTPEIRRTETGLY